MGNATLYDSDFYGWANQQAALLRSGELTQADLTNIAEELESMGRRERDELINRMAVLLLHLLKWQAQPHLRGRSWLLTIAEQRRQAMLTLQDNPSLKPILRTVLERAYGTALLAAQRETGLPASAFPPDCPWTFDQALQDAITL